MCGMQMVSPRGIERMQQYFGGRIAVIDVKGNCRELYKISYSSDNAAFVTESLLPYLDIKKAEAELALRYWKLLRRAPILHRERILSEYYTERTPFLLGGARNGGSRGKDKKPRKKRGGLKAIPLQYQKSRLI